MKAQWKGFLSGALVTLMLVGLIGSAVAASRQEQATLDYTGIKITLDGKSVTPTDANGSAVEPFAIAGTTYLPVRGIASALGLTVEWDQTTQTVMLKTGDGNTIPSTTGELRFYPNSTVPMLENVTNVDYSSSFASSDGTGGLYKYPISALPDIDQSSGHSFISDYVSLLKEQGFTLVAMPGEDGIIFMDNSTTGESMMLEAVAPSDGFDDYYIVISIFFSR